jgi:hypothetical protein
MSNKIIKSSQLHLDTSYQNLLTEIKERLKKAQLRAAVVVNHELIKFYWDIGSLLCMVVELKRGDFSPKDTGQLNFYLSAVDEQLKMPEDGPTIGFLLCEKKDKVIAEYSLRRVSSPMGIAEYELSKSLTEKLNNVLPTTEEIETELSAYTESIKILGDDNASED